MTNGAARPGRWSPLALAATWFGSGYLPAVPGTWGSLAALPAAALLQWLGGGLLLVAAAVILAVVGLLVTHRYATAHAIHDPQEVVIDEVVGQWLALAPLALSPLAYLLGFLLFRLIDTMKPWPIRRLERLPGGWGIMTDDTAAGIVAGALGYMIFNFVGQV